MNYKKIEEYIENRPFLNKTMKIIKKILDDDIFGLSAELTFYLTMSFFPFLILLLALISVTPLTAEDTLFKLLSTLPREVYDVAMYMLTGVSRSTPIIIASGVVALWSVSCAIKTINKALNRMYKVAESRSFVLIRSLGFLFALLLAVIIILTFFLLILGNVIGLAITRLLPSFQGIWQILRWLIVLFAVFFSFSSIYKILPNKALKYKSVIFGAIFSTFVWIIASTFFSFYADNFSNYHILYGSLAGIVVLISWLYMTSIIIFIGGEINSISDILKIPVIKRDR